MEILFVLLFLVAIYFLYTIKNDFSDKLSNLESRIIQLQEYVKQLQNMSSQDVKATNPPEIKERNLPDINEKVSEQNTKKDLNPKRVISSKERMVINEPSVAPKWVISPPLRKPIAKEPELSFFERYPDLEKFIGENLVNKIGIAILVLSIAYFVKYAIDSNWIGPAGRVGIGVLCGAIIIAFAHRMRNTYKAFSSVLVGGGVAVFYFTITLAYHQFQLFSQPVAFVILIIITVFAVALSLLYDRQELAVIALIGGFGSPFMVTTGHANYHALFIYLLILNVGLLVIAYFKAWRILNISAFALTSIIVAGVIYAIPDTGYLLTFIYATIFYLLFFTINIANNIRENKRFVHSDFAILLINTSLYFAAGLFLLTSMQHEELRGLFCAALALINLILSYILLRNKQVDKNVLYLLIGITLSFISLTAPIQLQGNYITLFWASECVILYWLYLKSDIKLTKLAAILVWFAMLFSLLIDWIDIYSGADSYRVILNKGFLTSLYTAIASFILFVLVKRDNNTENLYGFKIPKNLFLITSVLLFFLTGFLEINHQFITRYSHTNLNVIYLMMYVPAFIYLFNYLSGKFSTITLNWELRAGLLTVSISVFLVLTTTYFSVQREMLQIEKISTIHFIAHWLGAIIIGGTFYEFIQIIKANKQSGSATITWITTAAIVFFLSIEVALISNMIFYSTTNTINRIQMVYIKTGLPVLWGLLSFILMQLGMKRKIRILRIISLSLFTLTLGKLFLFDIRNIPAAGKIAAFFCLGIMLLSISFMYQKVKHLIIEDESKPKEEV
ncbi:MAG: hypothetical protein JWQ25_1979 [Daejeonella sp.]|nr:hypothetical protein [Daejeonella sp.]